MSITRFGTTKRWSDATVFNNVVYMVEVPATTSANITEQSIELLQLVEQGLCKYGSNKSQILSVTIFLKNICQIAEFNQVWDAWLPDNTAPSRACIEANLADENYLVEIQLTAAVV